MDRPVEKWGVAAVTLPAAAPGDWARTPLTHAQRVTFAGLILVCTAGFVAMPMLAAEILIGATIVLASGHMMFRSVLWIAGLRALP